MTPMFVTENTVLPPYMCSRCRADSPKRDWFIDTGITTEWDGLIYLCEACCLDVGVAAPNLMTVARFESIQTSWQEKLDKAEEAIATLGKMKDYLIGLGFAVDTYFIEAIERYDNGRDVSGIDAPESDVIRNDEGDAGGSVKSDERPSRPIFGVQGVSVTRTLNL